MEGERPTRSDDWVLSSRAGCSPSILVWFDMDFLIL